MSCARIGTTTAAAAALLLSGSALVSPAAGAATAGAQIALSRSVGPPTSTVNVSGSGFGASEAVTISFDSTSLAGTSTSDSGTFGPAKITIPASALPGRHTISATGTSTGSVATATFTVQADWAQFRFGPAHSGVNRFENVLSVSNAASLQNKWTLVTGAGVDSSPAVAGGDVYVGSRDGNLYAERASMPSSVLPDPGGATM